MLNHDDGDDDGDDGYCDEDDNDFDGNDARFKIAYDT